jgi:hypothetical protein
MCTWGLGPGLTLYTNNVILGTLGRPQLDLLLDGRSVMPTRLHPNENSGHQGLGKLSWLSLLTTHLQISFAGKTEIVHTMFRGRKTGAQHAVSPRHCPMPFLPWLIVTVSFHCNNCNSEYDSFLEFCKSL